MHVASSGAFRWSNRIRAAAFGCGTLAAVALAAPSAWALGPKLIDSITLSSTNACVGEPIKVVVQLRQPQPKNTVAVRINGLTGSRQHLQFFGRPGKRRIHVAAANAAREVESQVKEVSVRDCGRRYLRVSTRPNPYHEFHVDFTVVNHQEAGPRARYEWDFGDGKRARTAVPYASHDYSGSLGSDGTAKSFDVTVSLASAGPFAAAQGIKKTVTVFSNDDRRRRQGFARAWTTTSGTLRATERWLAGSYTIRNPGSDWMQFDGATVEYQPCDPDQRSRYAQATPASMLLRDGSPTSPSLPEDPGTAPTTPVAVPVGPGAAPVVRTLPAATVASPTTATIGTIAPSVPAAGVSSGTAVVTPTGPGLSGAAPPAATSTSVRLGAGQEHRGFVSVRQAELPADVCGLAYHLSGRTAGNLPAYASLYFRARSNPELAAPVADAAMRSFLDEVSRRFATGRPVISQEDLYRWEQEGKVKRSVNGWEVVR
jgi:hypothetical protein